MLRREGVRRELVRLLRGSRIFKAWEMRLSINYAYLELFSVTCLIVGISHWWACVWGMQASFDPLNSWLGAKGYCVAWGPESISLADANELLAAPVGTPGACAEGRVCSIGFCDDNDMCSVGVECVPWSLACARLPAPRVAACACSSTFLRARPRAPRASGCAST